VPAILQSEDFQLVGAIGRRGQGRDVALVLGLDAPVGVPVTASLSEALGSGPADVLIDYTVAPVAAVVCLAAVRAGIAVVLATTAVDRQAVEEIGRVATERGVGVFLAPNLTIAGQLMIRCAELAAPYFGDVEIVDSHSPTKRDAPSGTALETARRINSVSSPPGTEDMTERGLPESRGATVGRVRMHSVRLPSFYSRHEVVLSRPGEMLTITCDQLSTEAVIGPTLKAARLILDGRGLVRELPGLFDPD
jgi:4-hydroxy-tetrahydrodipicolinate reductase